MSGICENGIPIGGPIANDRDICWNLAKTECVNCGRQLCWSCAESCYQCGGNLCPGNWCQDDHRRATDHDVDHPGIKLASALNDESIDRLADHVARIVDKGAA
jgi:hypothetical protein